MSIDVVSEYLSGVAHFVPCVQMDADPNDHGHERVMLFGMDHHGMKTVMVQNTVVDPFRAGTVIIGIFPLLCSPGNRSIQPDIPFCFGMESPSIRRS